MTFADLFDELKSRGVLSRAAVKKSYLKSLAAALGYATLETCPVGAACRDPDQWEPVLDTYLDALTAARKTTGEGKPKGKPISAFTRRNTKSELRDFFRQAAKHGLLAEPLLPVLLKPITRQAFVRERKNTSPYKGSYNNHVQGRYGLRQDAWPPDIQAGWEVYRTACRRSSGRRSDARSGRRIRATTHAGYVAGLETFFGYRLNICGEQPTWEDLFEPEYLDAFVTWHAKRVGQQETSAHGWHVVIGAAAIARRIGHSRADEVLDFSRTVDRPPLLHKKRDYHWVKLTELDRIAEACMREGRRPYLSHSAVRSPGVRGATRFQRGLILKLMIRIPIRSRNVREMRLGQGKNLFQDYEGHWHLEFRGAELKVGRRGKETNEYRVDITEDCPDLVGPLEEFLTTYRPRIPNTTEGGPVFMTQLGTPYDAGSLRTEIGTIVDRYTGRRFFPHMIRYIAGSEYLDDHPGDFAAVAEMLGDTLKVVMDTYYDRVPKAERAKVGVWQQAKFNVAPTTERGA